MDEVMQKKAPERVEQRREHRARVLKGGSILAGIDSNEIKCTVRNQTANGAELRIEVGTNVPSHEFLLYIPVDNLAYRSVVRWRLENRIGVMFIGTEPKPSWHYG